jgi:regulator of protease activity HflC (stomatin/prohibitin superfamily)
MSIGGDMTGDMIQLPKYLVEDSPRLVDRMKAFEEGHQKAIDAAKLLGDVEDIPRLKKEAAAEADKQSVLTREAKEAAKKIISGAEGEATEIFAAAETEAEKLIADAKEMTARSEEVNKAAIKVSQTTVERLRQVEKREKDLADGWEKLMTQEENLDSLKTQLLQEKSKLASVREHVDQIDQILR